MMGIAGMALGFAPKWGKQSKLAKWARFATSDVLLMLAIAVSTGSILYVLYLPYHDEQPASNESLIELASKNACVKESILDFYKKSNRPITNYNLAKFVSLCKELDKAQQQRQVIKNLSNN